jgi:lipopolysaccharide/colanic/teichoic acid biosynthesis glycosyltransferase
LNRAVTLLLSVPIGLLLLPILVVAAALLVIFDGWPMLFRQARIGVGGRVFQLVKLRTMKPNTGDVFATGGDKASRITRIGRTFRKHRIDELPQLINVLSGDMALVGPRPPLPRYVGLRPDLYAPIMIVPPGITGLASVLYSRTEERLLKTTTSAAETEAVYLGICVPQKCRLERFYVARRSMGFDILIMYWTLARFLPLPGRRSARIYRGGPAATRSAAVVAQS